jgi:glyoxylase-like metal-dependent hydrolase (beta-lactamase superfamily II)
VTPQQVVPGVWRAGTRYVNWYAVDAGAAGVTLIDAGLPGYKRGLDPSLAAIGKTRSDVQAVVLTHGHIDHIGMAATLAAGGSTIHLHPADTGLATEPGTNTSDRSSLLYLRYPGSWMFVAHALREHVTKPERMPATTPLVDGQEADVPGRPLVTHVPGHTDGSCVLEFREHGVVFLGDLLCTVSPVTWRSADPQLHTRGSNRNSDQALTSLERLDGVTAATVLPGHGPPWRDGVEAAVASARRIGCR